MNELPSWVSWLNSLANPLLVLVTTAYAVLTYFLARSARASALASQKAAEAAELHLQATTTPVVLWTQLGASLSAERIAIGFRLQNVGPTAAIKVAVAPVRYQFDGVKSQHDFLPVAALIPGGGESSFPAGGQSSNYQFPDKDRLPDEDQWRFAIDRGDYGLAVIYSDPSGRWWRTELRLNGVAFLLESIEPPDLG